jgi:hypothetical protein
MRHSTKIIKALAKANGPLVKGDVGTGLSTHKFPQGETSEKIKNALLYLLLDLSVDLGIRDSIDRELLEKELGI